MKALILNGAFSGQDLLDQAGDLLAQELQRRQWETVVFRLREMNIRECVGCFNCWVKTPGLCATQDDAVELNRQMSQSDLIVFLTPIHFGGYGSILKRAMERTVLPNLLPFLYSYGGETHHPTRYGKHPRILAIGTLPNRDPEMEWIFSNLLNRNTRNTHGAQSSTAFLYNGMNSVTVQETVRNLVRQAEVN
jgi:multimeric flavodoxin WrbA